jgi:hypothetical protein
MIRNFFCSHLLLVLVWTDAETLRVAEGANGAIVEARIADAIIAEVRMLMLQFMNLHFKSFKFSGP